jgi:hypothetical protein
MAHRDYLIVENQSRRPTRSITFFFEITKSWPSIEAQKIIACMEKKGREANAKWISTVGLTECQQQRSYCFLVAEKTGRYLAPHLDQIVGQCRCGLRVKWLTITLTIGPASPFGGMHPRYF